MMFQISWNAHQYIDDNSVVLIRWLDYTSIYRDDTQLEGLLPGKFIFFSLRVGSLSSVEFCHYGRNGIYFLSLFSFLSCPSLILVFYRYLVLSDDIFLWLVPITIGGRKCTAAITTMATILRSMPWVYAKRLDFRLPVIIEKSSRIW